MIDKSELRPGMCLNHDHLGVVVYTDLCQFLEVGYGKPDTLYVEHMGETLEVTLALISYLTK